MERVKRIEKGRGDTMGKASNIGKIIVGIALLAIGICWYFVRIPLLGDVVASGELVPFWRSFLVIFAACFGIFLFLVGLLLAWISYEDYKI
jgi:hypothetical protein